MQKRVMCIWLPNWPSQRAFAAKRQADPQPIGPIILYRRDPRRGNVVATANQTARYAGVLPHMPLSQCGTLCPDACVLEYDPQSDLEALVRLAEAAQSFSPIVGLETLDKDIWAGRSVHEPQSLLMDITGLSNLFDGERSIAQAVHRWLLQKGYLGCLAIASQVGQAWAFANYRFRNSIADKLFQLEREPQKLKSIYDTELESIVLVDSPNPAKTDSADLRVEWGILPIEALRLDVANCTKLHRLGIRKVSQLLQLPRTSLTSRFGDILLRRIDQLTGSQQETIHALHASPELEIDEVLEFPTPHPGDVRAILDTHIRTLCKRLDELGHGALRVVCRVSLERNAFDADEEWQRDKTSPPTELEAKPQQALASILQLGLYQPTSDPEHLMWLMQTQLDAPSFRLGASYWAKGIRTQITLSAPLVWSQSSLFDSDIVKHRDAIAKFVDNVSVRLGRENVLTPITSPNPLPEATFQWRPLTGWRKDGSQQEVKRKLRRPPKRDYQAEMVSVGPQKGDVWRRPNRLLPKPLPLSVTEFSAINLPAMVRYPKANSSVIRCIGPERVESGWWQGDSQRRDYYRIELDNGTWLWCYSDLQHRTWKIHGIFD